MLVTLFSWGYWDWGGVTPKLVSAVDAVESARGFEPPLFVDVRFSRSVRAAGFRQGAFEKLLGPERYRWMKGLGNSCIGARSGPTMQIADPSAARDLLDLAIEFAKDKRRIIYFCSCKAPPVKDQEACHRFEVGRLLAHDASVRGLKVELIEWPGGEPSSLAIDVSSQLFGEVKRDRPFLPVVTPDGKLAEYAGLAWGSLLTVRCGDQTVVAVTGPAKFAGGWKLPILSWHDRLNEAQAESAAFLISSGYAALHADNLGDKRGESRLAQGA